MVTNKKPSGFIFYRGKSLINGAPIVGVTITSSSNVKTGNMVQTYILVDNGRSPIDNVRALEDAAVCGDCKHRRGTGGACYVNLGQGPRAVADGVVRGIYPESMEDAIHACKDRIVRLGTYGDPAAIPSQIWDRLLSLASDHTGYTHQWRKSFAMDHMHLCMASVDSEFERDLAKAMGYRTFRIRTEEQKTVKGEFICPASKEAGMKKTCSTCTACDGGVNTRKADPVIVVHGSLAARFKAFASL